MLNRQDGFITNMTARILAKMACGSKELMDGSDLHFYLTWLKDQLKLPVSTHSVGRMGIFFVRLTLLCKIISGERVHSVCGTVLANDAED